jgi:hypothetical protein
MSMKERSMMTVSQLRMEDMSGEYLGKSLWVIYCTESHTEKDFTELLKHVETLRN